MITVTVMYPNDADKKFDLDYYVNTHIPMVQRLLGPEGLVRGEVEKGISGTDPNSPPTYVVVGHLYFNTVEEVHSGFMTHGREIMGDIKNFTEIAPVFQISETVE